MRQAVHLSLRLIMAVPVPTTGTLYLGQSWGWQGITCSRGGARVREGLGRAVSCIQETLNKQCVCCVFMLQMEKHRECEVFTFLPGSAADVQDEFRDVFGSAHPWALLNAKTCSRVCVGKAACPEGCRLPQGGCRGTGLLRGVAATGGTLQRPTAIWETPARWKI